MSQYYDNLLTYAPPPPDNGANVMYVNIPQPPQLPQEELQEPNVHDFQRMEAERINNYRSYTPPLQLLPPQQLSVYNENQRPFLQQNLNQRFEPGQRMYFPRHNLYSNVVRMSCAIAGPPVRPLQQQEAERILATTSGGPPGQIIYNQPPQQQEAESAHATTADGPPGKIINNQPPQLQEAEKIRATTAGGCPEQIINNQQPQQQEAESARTTTAPGFSAQKNLAQGSNLETNVHESQQNQR